MRHPNYLGEMVLYGSFAVVAGHWIPWLVPAWVWLALFVPNMLGKEASMSRYPEWAAYKARTGMLLPAASPPCRGSGRTVRGGRWGQRRCCRPCSAHGD